MYCADAPRRVAAGSLRAALTVSRAGRQVFDGPTEAARDPLLRRYLSDLTAPYGVALREEPFSLGAGQSYGEMAGAVLTGMLPAGEPVDLLVCAYAVSDVVPGRSTAAYLSHLCPGAPAAFAVCDQGVAAPHTALRLIGAYASTAGCRRSVLVVVEQDTLHYDLPAPAAWPARSAAVALTLDRPDRDGAGVRVRHHMDAGPSSVAGLLEDELAGRDDVTLIAGAGLRHVPVPASEVILAPPQQPCTGVWWELAGGLPRWQADGRRVILADYDQALRYLCISVIDF